LPKRSSESVTHQLPQSKTRSYKKQVVDYIYIPGVFYDTIHFIYILNTQ